MAGPLTWENSRQLRIGGVCSTFPSCVIRWERQRVIIVTRPPSDDVSKPANLPQSKEGSGISLGMPIENTLTATDVNTLTLLSLILHLIFAVSSPQLSSLLF